MSQQVLWEGPGDRRATSRLEKQANTCQVTRADMGPVEDRPADSRGRCLRLKVAKKHMHRLSLWPVGQAWGSSLPVLFAFLFFLPLFPPYWEEACYARGGPDCNEEMEKPWGRVGLAQHDLRCSLFLTASRWYYVGHGILGSLGP